jgi:type II secretory pathway pseudopilin PulG
VKLPSKSYFRSQGGFTLVEVIITSLISMVLMSALTSVVLTTWRANTTATSRVEASSQIRNFQLRAYEDFARSKLPATTGCGANQANPCTTTPVVVTGLQVTDPGQLSTSPYQVSYAWDGTAFLDRQAASDPPTHIATNVSSFGWYVDGNTLVVNLTITIKDLQSNPVYSESQVLRFYPRVT